MNLKKSLIEHIKSRGSIKGLARKSRYDMANLSRFVRGQKRGMRVQTLERLISHLGLELALVEKIPATTEKG